MAANKDNLKLLKPYERLLKNSRFWILSLGITGSVLIAGMVQYAIPSGSLQTIRIEQYYGFLSLFFLYIAVLASPLTKVFPEVKFKNAYLHARRAIGVLAFYFAALHVYITFFKQLNGFSGISFYTSKYQESLLFGVIAFGILFVMTATSLDWVVRLMHFKNWKLLHRLVYVACVTVLLHVVILGPHFTNESFLGVITYVAFGFLVLLEVTRIRQSISLRHAKDEKKI